MPKEDVKYEVDHLGELTAQLNATLDERDANLRRGFDDVLTKHKLQGLSDEIDKVEDELAKLATKDEVDAAHAGLDSAQKTIEGLKNEVRAVTVALERSGGAADVETLLADHKSYLLEHATLEMKEGRFDTAFDESRINREEIDAYQKAFDRILRGDRRALDEANRGEVKIYRERVDSLGGHWVPHSTSSKILDELYDRNPMRRLSRVERIGGDRLEFSVNEGEVEVYWGNELEDTPESKTTKFRLIDIPVYDATTILPVSRNLLEDATRDVEGFIRDRVAKAYAQSEGRRFLMGVEGSGPRGILTYEDDPNGADVQKIQHVNVDGADLFTSFALLEGELDEEFAAGASLIMSRRSRARVRMLKDNDGRPLWQPDLQTGGPSRVLDFPVVTMDNMPDAFVPGAVDGAPIANAKAFALGNFQEAYCVVDRLSQWVQVNPYTKGGKKVIYNYRMRTGGGLLDGRAIKIGVMA